MPCFSYCFCLMMNGSGSVPLTNRSGSERPKNLRIWIHIQNTAVQALASLTSYYFLLVCIIFIRKNFTFNYITVILHIFSTLYYMCWWCVAGAGAWTLHYSQLAAVPDPAGSLSRASHRRHRVPPLTVRHLCAPSQPRGEQQLRQDRPIL